MFSHFETLIVIVVVPIVVAFISVTVAKEMWDLSGLVTLGIGIGGWILGFVVGALGSTVVHSLFEGSNDGGSD